MQLVHEMQLLNKMALMSKNGQRFPNFRTRYVCIIHFYRGLFKFSKNNQTVLTYIRKIQIADQSKTHKTAIVRYRNVYTLVGSFPKGLEHLVAGLTTLTWLKLLFLSRITCMSFQMADNPMLVLPKLIAIQLQITGIYQTNNVCPVLDCLFYRGMENRTASQRD